MGNGHRVVESTGLTTPSKSYWKYTPFLKALLRWNVGGDTLHGGLPSSKMQYEWVWHQKLVFQAVPSKDWIHGPAHQGVEIGVAQLPITPSEPLGKFQPPVFKIKLLTRWLWSEERDILSQFLRITWKWLYTDSVPKISRMVSQLG